MSDQTRIVAARAPDGVRITTYARNGAVVIQATLPWRRAMLLGCDLVRLSAEPFFQLGNEPAGHAARPGTPPADAAAGPTESSDHEPRTV